MKQQDAKKPAKSKSAGKGKKRKKLTLNDKLGAMLAAAAIVLAAGVSFGVVMYLNAVRTPTAEIVSSVLDAPAPAPAVPAPPPPPVAPLPAPAAALPAAPAAWVQPILPPPEPPAPVSVPAGSAGTLVFVIDDAGHNLRDLQPFLDFPGALTIAVLPGLTYSAEAARRIRAAGKELFLHQPMESLGGTNPGPGAIMAGMDSGEIRDIINRNLDEIGDVAGMNNHEGSRITMDEAAMETILSLSRERDILFLDSRTTAETAAPRVARRLGMTIAERDIFVDNVQERESMLYFINRGLDRARHSGSAILIGHIWSRELAPLLKEMYADLIEQGFVFSSVADVLARQQL